MKKSAFTNGIIPFACGISEKSIRSAVRKYRRLRPRDKRTDEQLRPYVINTLLGMATNFKNERLRLADNGLSIVYENFTGKIVCTANSTEIAKEMVKRWNARVHRPEDDVINCDHPPKMADDYHDSSKICHKCGCVIEQFGEKIIPPHKLF